MRIAFSTISCPDYTAAQVAEAARAYGYDGVELYALEGNRLLPELLRERRDTLARELRGVPIVSINSWASLTASLGPGVVPDPTDSESPEGMVVETMELAATLECPLVKAFGGAFPPGHDDATVIAHVAASAERLAAHARRTGVRLAIETHDGFCRGETLAAVLGQVADTDHVGALWDVHHPYRMGEPVERTAELIGAGVVHAHVKDAVRAGDGWRFVPLGDGELPVRAMLAALADRGFDGVVSVDWEKMWHPELEGPRTVLPQYAATLRSYVG